jgi:hypothetical protein
LIFYYYFLVLNKDFKSITIRYLKSGHSHFSPDRNFGHIEIQKKKEDLYNMEETIQMIKYSNQTGNQIVTEMKVFKDFKSYYEGFFNQLTNITQAGEIYINGDKNIYWSSNFNLEKKLEKFEFKKEFLKDINENQLKEVLKDQEMKEITEAKKKDLEEIYLTLKIPEKYKKDYYFCIKENKEKEKKEKKEKKNLEKIEKKIIKNKKKENYVEKKINEDFKEDDLKNLKLNDLKKFCITEGIKKTGNKLQLVKNILNYFQTKETGFKRKRKTSKEKNVNEKKKKNFFIKKIKNFSKCEK